MLPNSPIINIVTHFYLPHLGGIENYSYNLAHHLSKNNYKVNIITSKVSRDDPFYLETADAGIFKINSLLLINKRYPIPYSIKQILLIFRKAFYHKKSITIINSRIFFISLLFLFIAKINGSRIFFIEHSSNHIAYSNKYISFISNIYEHIATILIRLFKVDFYGDCYAANNYLKTFNINAKGVLYNTVDLEGINSRLFGRLNYNMELRFISFIGRLIPEKGVLNLLDAFIEFSKDKSDYRLLIAGSGMLEKKIREIEKQYTNIKYLGSLKKDDVYNLLAKTSCLVNPSGYPEGLQLVLAEAGAFAVPVISTPNGGAKEVIVHKDTGFIIPNNSIGSIKAALEEFDKYPDEFYQFGRNLNKLIETKLNWKIVSSKLIRILQ